QTAEFKERYRYRAGVEATMSDLDRVTGIKHLRVRGMIPIRLAATLKATGLNIRRAAAFISKGGRPRSGDNSPISNSRQRFSVFKACLRIKLEYLKTFAVQFNLCGNIPGDSADLAA
ncbi:MAG: transposase, partial [Desulfuromonadales bacterium]|nr:transposase [Desulfuromonadales bacterium]